MFDRTIKSGTALLENAIEAIGAILAEEYGILKGARYRGC
jgi:hypothetical protein